VERPEYLRERAATYRQLADRAESECFAKWLRAVADTFVAGAVEHEAAAELAAEFGKRASSHASF
jgi:hypothetical protein